MKRCPNCGHSGRPRMEPAWLILVAAIVWLIPLSFLSFGYWPFFLLPAIAITAWAVLAVRRRCPSCHQPWHNKPADTEAS